MGSDVKVMLSKGEVLYLRNTDFLPQSLRQFIEPIQVEAEQVSVTVSRDVAERLRDVFTERLAKVGFDEGYDSTSEGAMLEGLIDRFYLA